MNEFELTVLERLEWIVGFLVVVILGLGGLLATTSRRK